MKAVVIYYSHYGTTRQYAEWIADELGADLYDLKRMKDLQLSHYDTVVIGSALYAGSIKGTDFLVKYQDELRSKKLVLFTCGLADYTKQIHIDAISKKIEPVLPDSLKAQIKKFFLRGGISYRRLSLIHRIAMAFVRQSARRKGIDNIDDEDKLLLETYGKTVDFTDRASIAELVEYCK